MARILETRRLTPVTKFFRARRAAHRGVGAARDSSSCSACARAASAFRSRSPTTIAPRARITIVVQEVGATTTRVCALEAGDEILDVAGPLGGQIEIPPGGHVCGVGGGFGSAALLCLMREFTARGRQDHGHPRRAQQGPADPRRRIAAAVPQRRDLHRRRLGRVQRLRHAAPRAADRRGRARTARPRGRDRPDGDDARGRGDHARPRGEDAGLDGSADGRRHRHVRRVPRQRRRARRSSRASTARASMPTRSTSTSRCAATRRTCKEEKQALDRLTCMANREAR